MARRLEILTDQEIIDIMTAKQQRRKGADDALPDGNLFNITDEQVNWNKRYLFFADELIKRGYQPRDYIEITIWEKQ